MRPETMAASSIVPCPVWTVQRQAVEVPGEGPQRGLKRQNCFRIRGQSTVVRCLEDDGVLQEPHSLGDSEELSSGDDASGRSAGTEDSTKSTPAAVPVYYDDDNNDDCDDSKTPFLEKKSPQELQHIETLKTQLLSTVVGLDRGFAANDSQVAMVCKAANKLEAAQGIISLEKSENESALNGLNGVWRLVFSSAFKTGNLGGNRPGPFSIQLLGSPFSLGQVSQRIRVKEGTLDNIVQLDGIQPPKIPRFPTISFPTLQLSLMHNFVLSGPASIKITFREASLELLNSGVQVLSLQPPSFLSSLQSLLRTSSGSNQDLGEFSCAFSDEGMRITKGDRGELRVFVRDDTQTYI